MSIYTTGLSQSEKSGGKRKDTTGWKAFAHGADVGVLLTDVWMASDQQGCSGENGNRKGD
jgi:hypothetical protein